MSLALGQVKYQQAKSKAYQQHRQSNQNELYSIISYHTVKAVMSHVIRRQQPMSAPGRAHTATNDVTPPRMLIYVLAFIPPSSKKLEEITTTSLKQSRQGVFRQGNIYTTNSCYTYMKRDQNCTTNTEFQEHPQNHFNCQR